jgi:L-galactono-1,4-lactone dehydrogenase
MVNLFLLDSLLAIDPLDLDHVKRCNQAEAEFWKRNEGYQTKPSDKLLQFDCGGQVRILFFHSTTS